MNLITFPLSIGMQNNAVGDLQDALLFLVESRTIDLNNSPAGLLDRLRAERAERVYKDSTTEIVMRFQEQRHMEPPERGAVDALTASALNLLLRQFGMLSEAGSGLTALAEVLRDQGGSLKEIAGTVRDQSNTMGAINAGTEHLASIDQKIASLAQSPGLSFSMRGDAVKDLHAQLSTLGIALPEGETGDTIYGVATRDAVVQLQARANLPATGVLDEPTRSALNLAVEQVTRPQRVEGRIYLDNGLPAAKVTLKIVNRSFGTDETVLDTIQTDERGYYSLRYDTFGAAVNLEVRAVAGEDQTIRLSAPKVRAGRSEVINLVAPAGVVSQASEWSLLANDLAPMVGTDLTRLAEAQEDKDHPDLSLLHKSTNWDARLLVAATAAVKTSIATGIGQDALYGVIRAGLPDDPETLAQVSKEAFNTALDRAQTAGLIKLKPEELQAAQNAFDAHQLVTLRQLRVPGTLSSVGEMLDRSPVDAVSKAAFEKLVVLHDGDDASLWKAAGEQGIAPEQIHNLQLQGKLAYLTLNNAPLTEALLAEIPTQTDLALLVEKDLYRKAAWIERLHSLALVDGQVDPEKLTALIPSAYAQPTLEERLDEYTGDLAQKVRRSYPTQVVSRMIHNDELNLGAQHAEMKAPLQMLLKNAVAQGFQLGRTPVEQFLKQQKDTVYANIDADQQALAVAGAKLLTRVYQTTPTDEAMITMLNLGFTSAQQVVAISREEFVDRHWSDFGSRKVTEKVWDKSMQITSTTFNIFTLAKKIDSSPPVQAISGSTDTHRKDKDQLKSLLLEYPTMQTLFGSLDFCDCEHCRSVLSPAAYLIDLLRFIDPPKQNWDLTLKTWKETHNGKAYDGPEYKFLKPYDAFIQRRPDLPHLPLTCENTNTAMPYIDLVNEILEYFVVNLQLNPGAAYDTGDATAPELLAEPQHLDPRAYEKLQGALYPLNLPFDLWLETVRSFCAYFETPLWQALETFRPTEALYPPQVNPLGYYRAQIFAEYLGISPTEYAIYTAPDLAHWPALYGYEGVSEADVLAELRSAKTLAQRLGVSYQELTELVKTGFLNPNLHELAILHKLGVAVEDVFRYEGHAAYQPANPEQLEDAPFVKAEFEKRLKQVTADSQTAIPGFDAKQWVDAAFAQNKFDKILVLRDPNAGCSFDETTFCYVDTPQADLEPLVYVRLNQFVRLWKRLGWTLEETDLALKACYPQHIAHNEAMQAVLIYLAHLQELSGLVNVGKNGRVKLLTLWSKLPTQGKNSLYAQLFLTRGILKDDGVFDHPLGDYLSDPNVRLKDHLPALQAALNLTADEIALILLDGGAGAEREIESAALLLDTVSLLYRYGLLARALKLPVSELITLKALSGLDPFHPLSDQALTRLDDDHPYQHTLEFVRRAQQVKASTFTVGDLDYLLRHTVDPRDAHQEDGPARRAWIRALAADLNSIARDYALPEHVDSLNGDSLRQKMLLVFAPDVVETFMTFWSNKATYSAIKTGIAPAKRLNPAVYGLLPAVSVVYDETRQQQQVTHTGVLTGAVKTALLAKIPPPAAGDQRAADALQTFTELLDEIAAKSEVQFKAFFNSQFDGLVALVDFFGADGTATPDLQRLSILEKILPFLRQKAVRQAILQTLSAQTDQNTGPSGPALLETLLSRSDFLSLPENDPPLALLNLFAGLQTRGLTLETSAQPNLTQLTRQAMPAPVIEVRPDNNINSVRWQGFIEVPKSGAYRFYALLGKQDAAAALRLDDSFEPVLSASAPADNSTLSGFYEFEAGRLYGLTVEASNLQNGAFELQVKGETSPRGKIDQLVALPLAAVDAAGRAFTLLSKALQLAQGLGLSERDVRHILKHAADFDDVDWRRLPTAALSPTAGAAVQARAAADAVALFKSTVRLLRYSALKQALAGGSDDLTAILERARRSPADSPADLCQSIATLTRRSPGVVQAAADALKLAAPADFASAANLERLWQALQVVEKFGVHMPALKKWLTPAPDSAAAMDVRRTIKAHYEPETWQRIAKGIFDPLRQRQRDALVAYILHLRPDLTSMEKLFEYFLIDPGTEPVVQTSRLRLAISSLQTFIQRCFLNLEPQVHPMVLNAQHWAWMKRYRVWEANRKIFLYPENWLEPEWRDDKTFLYQELESKLLQGDVTNQLAEDALYVYLKKLNQLARLEIISMYTEEKTSDTPIIHVVGRTYGLPHQYFYRRYSHHMWTAWEPVTTEIDSDYVALVMWRGQPHLFWLNFMERVQQSPDGPKVITDDPNATLAGMPVSKVINMAAQTSRSAAFHPVDVQLNWSEYYQGAWTTRESSGYDTFSGDFLGSIKDVPISLHIDKESDPDTGRDGALWITLYGLGAPLMRLPCYRVVSKNHRPRLQWSANLKNYRWPLPYTTTEQLESYTNPANGKNGLSVIFVQKIVTTDGSQQASPASPLPILSKDGFGDYRLLGSSNATTFPNKDFASLVAPLFYADDVYTFFVEPSITETTVDQWQGYTITRPSQKSKWSEYTQAGPGVSVVVPPKYREGALNVLPKLGERVVLDELALHPLKVSNDTLTQPGAAVRFGGVLIGPAGALQDQANVQNIIANIGGLYQK